MKIGIEKKNMSYTVQWPTVQLFNFLVVVLVAKWMVPAFAEEGRKEERPSSFKTNIEFKPSQLSMQVVDDLVLAFTSSSAAVAEEQK